MKRLEVLRWASTPYGVFSQGSYGSFECAFVETLNRLGDIKPRCILAGLYLAKLDMYYGGDGVGGVKKDYPAYELQNVDGFSEVKIHIANYFNQLEACLAPGAFIDWDVTKKLPMVTSSTSAFNSLMLVMNHEPVIEVNIQWADQRLAEVYF